MTANAAIMITSYHLELTNPPSILYMRCGGPSNSENLNASADELDKNVDRPHIVTKDYDVLPLPQPLLADATEPPFFDSSISRGDNILPVNENISKNDLSSPMNSNDVCAPTTIDNIIDY